MARFDKFHAETSAAPSSPGESPPRSSINGHGNGDAALPKSAKKGEASSEATYSRPKIEEEETPSRAVETSPRPPKKRRKVEEEDEDARLAAMLQAEENSRARTTRGAASRKAVPAKKKKGTSSKAKSAAKVEDDSAVTSDSERKKKRSVNRSGGFHVSISCSYSQWNPTKVNMLLTAPRNN